MTIDKEALAPCPFCGSSAAIENLSQPQHERHVTAGCSNEKCFAYLPSVYFAREAEARAAWNRRTPSGRAGEGWVMVPVDVTPEMRLAGLEAARKINPGRSEEHIKSVALDGLTIFRAMLHVAPNPPVSDKKEG